MGVSARGSVRPVFRHHPKVSSACDAEARIRIIDRFLGRRYGQSRVVPHPGGAFRRVSLHVYSPIAEQSAAEPRIRVRDDSNIGGRDFAVELMRASALMVVQRSSSEGSAKERLPTNTPGKDAADRHKSGAFEWTFIESTVGSRCGTLLCTVLEFPALVIRCRARRFGGSGAREESTGCAGSALSRPLSRHCRLRWLGACGSSGSYGCRRTWGLSVRAERLVGHGYGGRASQPR